MQPAMHVLLQTICDLAENDSTEGHDRWATGARKHTLRLHTSDEEDSTWFEEF
jgi:hypothetical protein